jgi:hypothetical protein
MFKKQKIDIYVERLYAKSYVQKIKQVIWNQIYTVCEVEDKSFETDECMDISLYFVATDDQLLAVTEILDTHFEELVFNFH